MNKSNKKILFLIILCLIIILIFWFISLQLNLQNGLDTSSAKSGLTFAELKNEIGKIISKSPLSKKTQNTRLDSAKRANNNKQDEQIDELTKKLAEELKNIDETSDWQTYSNEELRFEFKYPRDFKLDEEKDRVEHELIVSLTPTKDYDSQLPLVYFYVDSNSNNLSAQQYMNKYDEMGDVSEEGELTINNLKGYRKVVNHMGDIADMICLQHIQKIYQFSFHRERSTRFTTYDYSHYQGIFDQILSTFSFLE